MITSDQIASQFPQQQFGTQGGYYAPAPGPSAYPPQFTYQWNGGWQHRAAERAGEMRMRPYANLGDAFGQMAATAASVQMFAGGADAVGSLFGVDTFSSLANSRFLAGATRLDPFSSAFTGAMAGGSAAWGAGAGAVARGAIGGALGTGGLLHPVTLGAYGLVKAGESVYQGYREQKGVNALLGGYNFTNPSSFTGKGFSMEQKFQIGNTLRAFDSSDAYTSFQDALSVLERFNTLGMGQGVRSAEAFGKKFREMAETVRVMSKTMNTSIDEATSVFGALRMAGISSPGGMIGMGRTMRVLSSGGMTSADIAGMVNTGSAVSRSFGMR
ncbi:hypothetical protein EBT31_19575, partial [bacterium]|nr:hypothetical protein [bacterium]